MRFLKLLLALSGLLALVFAATPAAAQSTPTARILKIVGTGTATVVIDGQSVAATESLALPPNAQVTTTSQEVYIEVVPGVVATIKPRSVVKVDSLSGAAPTLELRQGALVSQIDKNRVAGRTYGVRTAKGVAAARGTSFTVTVTSGGFTIAATADTVSFTSTTGAVYSIRAGMVSVTPAGAAEPLPAVSLAEAATSNPEVVGIVRDAVQTAATVVQENLGSISADSATSILAQVVAVASATVPSEAATFTSQAVAAVTAPGSAAASTAATSAGAITAAAISAAPENAAAIAGAAAAAAPAQAGVITAAARQVAPQASDAITQNVAAATGQSTTTVQSNADAAASTATNAVNTAKDATSNVVTPLTSSSSPSPSSNPTPVSKVPPQVPVVLPDASNAGG